MTTEEINRRLLLHEFLLLTIKEYIRMKKKAASLRTFVVILNDYAKWTYIEFTEADVLTSGLVDVVATLVKKPLPVL